MKLRYMSDDDTTPLQIFVLICMICVVFLFFYRGVMSISILLIFAIIGSCVLFAIKDISVNFEWLCLILFTLPVLMCTFSFAHPDVFFYPKYS